MGIRIEYNNVYNCFIIIIQQHMVNEAINSTGIFSLVIYRISKNIGEHYIWRFAQKMLLAGF